MTNQLVPIEMNNQRILTTQQLAAVYETDTNNIKNNFANHKDHFRHLLFASYKFPSYVSAPTN